MFKFFKSAEQPPQQDDEQIDKRLKEIGEIREKPTEAEQIPEAPTKEIPPEVVGKIQEKEEEREGLKKRLEVIKKNIKPYEKGPADLKSPKDTATVRNLEDSIVKIDDEIEKLRKAA